MLTTTVHVANDVATPTTKLTIATPRARVPDALAERREPGDAGPPDENRVVAHHAIHPCVANACSIAPGSSASENEMRARRRFTSK